MRHTYVFDQERVDISVCRQQAIKRAEGDYHLASESTTIHFHPQGENCLGVMHELVHKHTDKDVRVDQYVPAEKNVG